MEPPVRLSTAFVVKRGYASFRQDGIITIWNKRWMILREDQLSWHRSDVRRRHRPGRVACTGVRID